MVGVEQDLRLLILDGSAADAEATVAELTRSGFRPLWRRVASESAFTQALSEPWDIVITEYLLEDITAPQVIGMVRRAGIQTPVILVACAVREEQAIACIRDGAFDFLLKDHLGRLGRAVRNAVAQASLAREKQRTEAALRRADEHLHQLLRSTPTILYRLDLDPERNDRWASENLTDLTGYTPEESYAPGWWTSNLHPDDRPRVVNAIDAHSEHRPIPTSDEYRFRFKDGRYHWILDSRRVVQRPDGGNDLVGTWSDITERKSAEERLIESQTRLNALFANAQDAIALMDPQGNIIDANEAALSMTGATRDQLVGRSYLELVPPEGRAKAAEDFIKANQMGRFASEMTIRRADGTLVDIAYRTVSNIVPGIGMVFANDITEKNRTRENLQLMASIVKHSEDAIGAMTLDGTVTFWNPAAERIYGYSASEIIGRNISMILPKGLEDHPHIAIHAIVEGHPPGRVETKRQRKDGVIIDMAVTYSGIYDDAGQLTGISVLARDITREKALADHLESSQRVEAMGRLAGGIAHDFNNILMVISLCSDVLLADVTEPHMREELTEIRKAADRAASLTRQLLAFSRRQILQPEVLSLNYIVSNLESMLRRLIGENVELKSILDANLADAKIDPGQMEQAIVNLVVNSRDAMPKGGRVVIETSNVRLDPTWWSDGRIDGVPKPGNYVMLSVSDTGTGMDKATVARIYEPFFTTKEKGKGTGLGLPMVHGIVKQSGGYIALTTAPGEGTTFRIYLPATLADDRPRVDETASPERPAERPTTILLAEDEESVRRLLERALSRRGYQVLTAHDGPDALRIAGSFNRHIDIMVTDTVMPGLSGWELAEQILAMRPSTRVIFMSGYANHGPESQAALRTGAPFLQKPLTPAILLNTIDGVLRRS